MCCASQKSAKTSHSHNIQRMRLYTGNIVGESDWMELGYSGWVGSGYSSHPVHPYPYRCLPVFQQTAVCNDGSPAITFTQQTNCDVTNVHLKVINLDKKYKFKVFTLKNSQSSWFASIAKLRKHLVLQLGSKVVSQYPDSGLGYMRGQIKV